MKVLRVILLVLGLFIIVACSDSHGGFVAPKPTTASASATSNGPTISPTRSNGPTIQPPVHEPSKTSEPSETNEPTETESSKCSSTTANPAVFAVRFGAHDSFDRVSFDVCTTEPLSVTANNVPEITEDGSGATVHFNSPTLYLVTIRMADASTAPRSLAVNGSAVKEIKQVGNFEGVVSYGIGATAFRPISSGTVKHDSFTTVYVDI